jgi:hypothetical protein
VTVARRKRLAVIPPGATVGIRVPKIADAVVLEVRIGAGPSVSYEVAWWDGAERFTDRLEESEIDADPTDRLTIGFLRPSSS